MARLIDADAAIEAARKSDELTGSDKWHTIDMIVFLDGQHTIDAVEVVRCNDCRFKTEPGQPNILCHHMKDDDFCSYGERRSGNATD